MYYSLFAFYNYCIIFSALMCYHILKSIHLIHRIVQTVVTGAVKLTNDGQTHQIKDIKLHPDYTGLEDGWTDDIAVITVS